MKIKKMKNINNKIIKLQALKLQREKKNTTMCEKNILQIHAYLNKLSNIIYKYAITKRKILFLGFPNSFKQILKNTKHVVIPEYSSLNGVLSNQTTLKKIIKPKKFDLVIIYNQNDKLTILKESYFARIPTIVFSKNFNFNNKSSYISLGNYKLISEKAKNNNFIFSFLKTILIRAKKNQYYSKK